MGQDEHSERSQPTSASVAESQREQRQDVLRSLTGQLPPPPAPPPPASSLWETLRAKRQEERQRRILRTVIALAVLGLAYIGGLALRDHLATRQTTTTTATATPGVSAPVLIPPFANNIHCPQAEAWSLDATQIAILGYEHGCPQNGFIQGTLSNSGVIGVYDASSGQPISTIPLDATALPTLSFLNLGPDKPIFHYSGLTYMPGSRNLLTSFTVRAPLSHGNTDAAYGIVASDYRGITLDAAAYPVSHPNTAGYFNVFSGRAAVPSAYAPLTPSLDYLWKGAVVPRLYAITPLSGGTPPASDPNHPIGNPAGDPLFSIWQPGLLVSGVAIGRDNQAVQAAGLYTFTPQPIIPTTPDGAAAYAPLSFTARLQPANLAAPSSQTLAQIAPLPQLPVRDIALQAVLQSIATPDSGTPTPHAVEIAWRPDGAVLAALPLDQNTHTITLYDIATGHAITTLAFPTKLATNDGAAPQLRWSPDGSHLLGITTDLSTVAVWDMSKLLG